MRENQTVVTPNPPIQLGSNVKLLTDTLIDPPLIFGKANLGKTTTVSDETVSDNTEQESEDAMICRIYQNTCIKVIKANVIERKRHMMIDIPATLEVGRGVRREIEMLHKADHPLEELFQMRQGLGDIIVIENHDIVYFYMICRSNLHDDFNFEAYQKSLGKVKSEMLKRGLSSIDTIKVPFHRVATANEVRDAILSNFEGTGIQVFLCVGDTSV